MHTEGLDIADIENGCFSGGGFALYRLSGESTFTYIARRGAVGPSGLSSITENAGVWIAAPFSETVESPFITLRPDVAEVHEVPDASGYCPISAEEVSAEAERRNYEKAFAYCHGLLQRVVVKKVVLSRRLSLKLQRRFNPVKAFYELCKQNPLSYVCLWWTPKSGFWLTATPETLVAKGGSAADAWHTMALAGTMACSGKLLPPEQWSGKNRKEQACVAAYITEKLRDIATYEAEATACHTIRAAGVMHLCTDISFRLKEGIGLSALIQTLHPTPAVCGAPPAAAREAILHSEETPRRYYAGFSGPVGINGATGLFVSLRCMHVEGNAATLYAGGGLMPESVLDDEWEETQRKLQPMLRLFETSC